MIDKKDKKILKELVKDGRKSFANLARSCKMTRQSIFSRIKSLKRRGIIEDFTVELNQKKLGLNLRAYILISSGISGESREKTIQFLRRLPQTSQIHRLFGRFDFLIEVLVKDIAELSKILEKIHELEIAIRTETMIVQKSMKYNLQHPIETALK